MTINKFFENALIQCKHIIVPGAVQDRLGNHLIFMQKDGDDSGERVVRVSRITDVIHAYGYITEEDFQLFLDARIGVSDLWRKCYMFFYRDYSRSIISRELTDEMLPILISPFEEDDE